MSRSTSSLSARAVDDLRERLHRMVEEAVAGLKSGAAVVRVDEWPDDPGRAVTIEVVPANSGCARFELIVSDDTIVMGLGEHGCRSERPTSEVLHDPEEYLGYAASALTAIIQGRYQETFWHLGQRLAKVEGKLRLDGEEETFSVRGPLLVPVGLTADIVNYAPY